jgi:hypothetical protein
MPSVWPFSTIITQPMRLSTNSRRTSRTGIVGDTESGARPWNNLTRSANSARSTLVAGIGRCVSVSV